MPRHYSITDGNLTQMFHEQPILRVPDSAVAATHWIVGEQSSMLNVIAAP